MATNEIPAGQRFAHWLGKAAKKTRDDADAHQSEVAGLARMDQRRVDRFEKAQTWPGVEVDRLMAAYAERAGLGDARVIYQRALDLWMQHGQAPALDGKDTSRAEQFTQQIAPASPARDAAEPERKTNATRKRSAG